MLQIHLIAREEDLNPEPSYYSSSVPTTRTHHLINDDIFVLFSHGIEEISFVKKYFSEYSHLIVRTVFN